MGLLKYWKLKNEDLKSEWSMQGFALYTFFRWLILNHLLPLSFSLSLSLSNPIILHYNFLNQQIQNSPTLLHTELYNWRTKPVRKPRHRKNKIQPNQTTKKKDKKKDKEKERKKTEWNGNYARCAECKLTNPELDLFWMFALVIFFIISVDPSMARCN